MSYEVVNYTPALGDAVSQLQTYLWSTDPALNAAYLQWKHERNPYVTQPLIYVALCDGQPVGMRAMFGSKWRIGDTGRTMAGVSAGDLVIAPEHRNRGLFGQIMQFACADLASRDYDYMFNLSAGSITFLSSLATGWRGIGSLAPLRWSGDRKAALAAAASGAGIFDALDAAALRGGSQPSVVVETAPWPAAMAELTGRIGAGHRLTHVRDEQYFGWRFGSPRSTYRFLYFGHSPLEGYLILRVPVDPARAQKVGVTIVDWEATTAAIRADLLQAAIECGAFQRVTIWSATLADDTRAILTARGFLPVKTKGGLAASRPTMLIRPVRSEMLRSEWLWAGRRLLDVANWDLRMIDSDGQ